MTEIKLQRCPICGKPSSAKARPFCSVRCADVDLGHWLTGSYAVPVAEDELDDDDNRDDIAGQGGSA